MLDERRIPEHREDNHGLGRFFGMILDDIFGHAHASLAVPVGPSWIRPVVDRGDEGSHGIVALRLRLRGDRYRHRLVFQMTCQLFIVTVTEDDVQLIGPFAVVSIGIPVEEGAWLIAEVKSNGSVPVNREFPLVVCQGEHRRPTVLDVPVDHLHGLFKGLFRHIYGSDRGSACFRRMVPYRGKVMSLTRIGKKDATLGDIDGAVFDDWFDGGGELGRLAYVNRSVV